MDEPPLFNALRADGVDADSPDIREAVRQAIAVVEEIQGRTDLHTARQCMTAMRIALDYALRHPDTNDMSLFEYDVDSDDPGRGATPEG